MDTQKVCRNVGIFVLIFLAAAPVLADVPPNDPLHVNSVGITSGELPAPLPSMPGPVALPSVSFPAVDMSELPVMADERAALEVLTKNRVTILRSALQSRYAEAMGAVASVRSVTDNLSNAVGNPATLSVHDGAQQTTVVGMAQRMSQSVSLGLSYVRAVSALGPMGLDLVFLFVGLGWVLFVNLASFAARLIGVVILMLGQVSEAFWKLAMLLSELTQIVIKIFDLFWPL